MQTHTKSVTAHTYSTVSGGVGVKCWHSDSYRFGFQGQEAENQLYGLGNASFFKYRISDNRIGRFFAIDPLAPDYPFYSPYAFSGNRVIDMVEMDGLQPAEFNVRIHISYNTITNESTIMDELTTFERIKGGEKYEGIYRVIQTTDKYIGEAWHSSETRVYHVSASDGTLDRDVRGNNNMEDPLIMVGILLPEVSIIEFRDKGKDAIEEVAPGVTKGDISKYIQEYIKVEENEKE